MKSDYTDVAIIGGGPGGYTAPPGPSGGFGDLDDDGELPF